MVFGDSAKENEYFKLLRSQAYRNQPNSVDIMRTQRYSNFDYLFNGYQNSVQPFTDATYVTSRKRKELTTSGK